MANVPSDCRYTQTHEWVRLEGTLAVVGISEHAQDSLGDITFVELPSTGATLEKGKEAGVIESVKAASDLYAPLSGKVDSINDSLESNPEQVNQDPHGAGWMYRLSGISTADYDSLMDASAYERFLETD